MLESPLLTDHYEILRPIARGGMALVLHGRERAGKERDVAIKRLLPSFRGNDRFKAMFLEEARVVSGLEHPHITNFYELCRDESDLLCIVMEWVEGTTLASVVQCLRDKEMAFDVEDAAFIMSRVLRGLGAAHSRAEGPVFHRDISPGNILLSLQGDAKLTDFGLARAMDRMTLTMPGVVFGKVAYVAPELLAGQRATARSDLYSVGILLWEMLAGRRLFPGTNPVQLFVQAGRAEIPPIEDIRSDLPLGMLEVVRGLTQKVPQRRLDDSVEVAERLEVLVTSARQPAIHKLVRRAQRMDAERYSQGE